MNEFSQYFQAMINTLDWGDWPEKTKTLYDLVKLRRDRGRVFLVGNGGSAATASHIAADLSKNAQVRAFALDSLPFMSAVANDTDFEFVFSGWLANHQLTKDDLLIAISTSGNSKNVLDAVEYAKSHGGFTVGMTGNSGGELGGLCHYHVRIPLRTIEMVEDIHLMILHSVVAELKRYAPA